MDDTITDEPIVADDAGADEALLAEDTKGDAAATEATEQKQDQTKGDEAPADKPGDASVPEVDAKLKSFAKGQGIEDFDALSDRERRLLKIAYDNNAEYQRSQQKASELEKTLSGGLQDDINNADLTDIEELKAKVQTMELAQSVNAFFVQNPEAKELEGTMAEIVTSRPDIGNLVKAGYLSIGDLYNLARGGDPSRDEKLKTAGGKEALEKVAAKQQAKAVTGSAMTSDMSDSIPEDDAFEKGFNAN